MKKTYHTLIYPTSTHSISISDAQITEITRDLLFWTVRPIFIAITAKDSGGPFQVISMTKGFFWSIHSFVYQPIRSVSHLTVHRFIHPVTHSLTHSLNHSFIHSSIHLLIHSLTPFTEQFSHSFTQSFQIHPFIYPLNRPFVPLAFINT